MVLTSSPRSARANSSRENRSSCGSPTFSSKLGAPVGVPNAEFTSRMSAVTLSPRLRLRLPRTEPPTMPLTIPRRASGSPSSFSMSATTKITRSGSSNTAGLPFTLQNDREAPGAKCVSSSSTSSNGPYLTTSKAGRGTGKPPTFTEEARSTTVTRTYGSSAPTSSVSLWQ